MSKKLALTIAVLVTAVSAASATASHFGRASTGSYGKCKVTGKGGQFKLKTTKPGTLTVELTGLTPPEYLGNTLSSVNNGYDYCIAANIAWRAGLPKIKLVLVDFAGLVAGATKRYDVAINDIFMNPAREKVVDFSIPYAAAWSVLIAPANTTLTQATVKDAQLGTVQGSVQQQFYEQQLKPTKTPRYFENTADLIASLKAGQLDGVLIDTGQGLPAVGSSGGLLKAVAQYKVGGQYGVLMPKGSVNRTPINKIVAQMLKDGTLKSLQAKFVLPTYGGLDPAKLPFWTAQ